MKKILTAFAAFVLGLVSLQAQVFFPQLTPLKNMKGDLYPQRQGEYWGYVNNKGKFIIKPVFESAEGFLRVAAPGVVLDVAKIKANGFWGYVSREGIYFIEPDYEYISNFGIFSTAMARKGSTYTLFGVEKTHSDNLNADVLKAIILDKGFSAEFSYSMRGYGIAMKDGRYGIIDTKGAWAVPCEYDLVVQDGSLYRIEKDGLMGLVSLDGKTIFPCEYKSIKPFYDDVNLITKAGGFGLARKDGTILLEAEYDSIDTRNETYLNLHKGNKLGMCDRSGKILIPVEYSSVQSLEDGNFKVFGDDGFNIYSPEGVRLFDQGYDSIEPGPRNGYLVSREGLHGRTDEEGKFIYPCVFEDIPDPDMNGYVELYFDDVPYIFLAGASAPISVKEYDDDNYRKMSERRYRESDVLPNWLKSHLPRRGGAKHWVLLKEGEIEVYSEDDLGELNLQAGLVYDNLLCYYYHEWAGILDIGLCMNGDKDYAPVLKEDGTVASFCLEPHSFAGVTGFEGVVYSIDLVIDTPAENGIALYRIVRTPHYWKRIRGYARDNGVGEPGTISCGYIGLGREFFVQPLFQEAEGFDGDTARVRIGSIWSSLTAEELTAMDPFLLPE